MDRRTIALAIAAFLAVLFISTIGSSLTGFVVTDNTKLTLAHYPFPFIKNNAYNDFYIVASDVYNNENYDAVYRIANSLRTTQPLYPKIVSSRSIPKGSHNLILVGNPCTNRLLGEALNAKTCSLNLREGEGLIQLINTRRTSTLIIAGDVDKVSRVLANKRLYPLSGKKVIVSGSKNSLQLKYVETE